MIKKFIQNANGNIENFLRQLVGRISPDKRVAVILTMMAVFCILSIYMTVSSILSFGRENYRPMEIERIEALSLQPETQRDNINRENNYNYGRTNE